MIPDSVPGPWGLALVLSLPLAMSAPSASAAHAAYYECDLEPSSQSLSWRPVRLRYMLNVRKKHAFRIERPAARPVRMEVSAHQDITLIDYVQDREVSVLTIRPDGAAIYSRHALGLGQSGGVQQAGRCFQVHDTARALPEDGTG
jgi:hypothetical protein